MFIHGTCVTHVIAIRCVLVHGDSTGIIDGSRVVAGFGFGCWCSVSTQISCLHGWGGLLQVHMTKQIADDLRESVDTLQTTDEEQPLLYLAERI